MRVRILYNEQEKAKTPLFVLRKLMYHENHKTTSKIPFKHPFSRLWVNLCKIGELPENAPNLALFGRKMGLKWLKTCEFGVKPDQFPEYRKNTLEMGGLLREQTGNRVKTCFGMSDIQETQKTKC